jgi:hypothetical protein
LSWCSRSSSFDSSSSSRRSTDRRTWQQQQQRSQPSRSMATAQESTCMYTMSCNLRSAGHASDQRPSCLEQICYNMLFVSCYIVASSAHLEDLIMHDILSRADVLAAAAAAAGC